MVYILAFCLFVFFISFGILYRIKKKNSNLIINLLRDLRNGNESKKIPKFLLEEYNQTLDKIKEQETKIEKSVDELKEYKKELELTYNALLIKSTQLENNNHMLERKVENLSNLNSISRAALSVLKVEKIINIIIDAYFVLTGVKRISLYLWENGTLINKKRKGGIKFDGEVSFSMDEIKNFAREDYEKIYEGLSKGFYVNNEEIVMTYPLNVKGKELGVFYIIEDKNKLSYIDEETISALVIQISIAINNAQIYRDLLTKERISQELEVAAKIQRQIIPKDIDKICGLEIANYFEPAKEIGGDYYDYTILDDNSFSLTIADVSGKGVPAAFLLALGRSILKTLTIIGDGKPEDELNKLNRIIFPDLSEDMFITMFHSKYLRDERTLYYSNAGHNPIVIYRAATNEVELHNIKGVAIGFIEDYKYKSGQVKLYKDDIILFYTDGLTEATNAENKLFGIENVKNIIYKNKEKSAIEVKNEILYAVKSFQGDAEQEDDLTFVVLKAIE